MSEATSRKREIIAVLAVLIVIAAIATTAIISANKKEDSASTPATNDTATTSQTATTDAAANTSVASDAPTTYKDGTYKATGNYNSPGGNEEISISVTLVNGTITATSAENEATDRTAQEYQDEFIAGYSSQVVGKSVAEVNLSRVSGSSLTSQGFNDALSQIRQQASS